MRGFQCRTVSPRGRELCGLGQGLGRKIGAVRRRTGAGRVPVRVVWFVLEVGHRRRWVGEGELSEHGSRGVLGEPRFLG